MSIDKFGRHIHKHVVKKHLTSHHNMKIFLSQRIAKEIIRNYIEDIISSEKPIVGRVKQRVKQKTILILYSIGIVNKNNSTFVLVDGTEQYRNKLFTGVVADVQTHSLGKINFSINIDGRVYSHREALRKPFELKSGSTIVFNYTGPKPVPQSDVPFRVEFLLEEYVSSEENSG